VSGAPLLVTGLPRSGTSWVGKMLEASDEVVYVNEPLNPRHPPGHSPGVLNARVTHRFQYICADNDEQWAPAFADTTTLRYRLGAELRQNRSAYDLARMAKYLWAFTSGRARGRRALLDDPFAVLSTPWLVSRIGAVPVVLVRDPVALVGSWRKLGWTVRFHELLEQPLLMRNWLGPYASELRELVGSQDDVAKISLLWRVTYDLIDQARALDPRIHVVRYEDLAGSPLTAFEELYAHCGLAWSNAVRAKIDAATSAAGGDTRSHVWSGLSRTAFRPMDSKAGLMSFRERLSEEDIIRVRTLTADVASRFYRPA
jgi:hypothetical protein